MNTKEVCLREVEEELLKLDYEITTLKFRVEEMSSEEMRECYQKIKVLRHRYDALESQVQRLREAQEENWRALYQETSGSLGEMLTLLESVDTLVRTGLTDEVDDLADLPWLIPEEVSAQEVEG
jgi:archaellum component FlaC